MRSEQLDHLLEPSSRSGLAVIALIVRIHDGADGLAGVVEFPGASRRPFRTGDELIELMTSWLHDRPADGRPPGDPEPR